MEIGTTVVSITMICYLIGEIVKATKLDNKWIPCIVGAFGGIVGIAGLYTMADFPASDVITAIAIGISSGLASTGLNQTIKQLTNKE